MPTKQLQQQQPTGKTVTNLRENKKQKTPRETTEPSELTAGNEEREENP